MSSVFRDHELLYTVRTEERDGLLAALEHIDPEAFEVILQPTGDVSKCTIRTETAEGAVAAVNDIAPQWSSAVVRVYTPEEVTA